MSKKVSRFKIDKETEIYDLEPSDYEIFKTQILGMLENLQNQINSLMGSTPDSGSSGSGSGSGSGNDNTGGNDPGTGGSTGGDDPGTGGSTGGDDPGTGGSTGGDDPGTGGSTGGDDPGTGGSTGGDDPGTGGSTGGDDPETETVTLIILPEEVRPLATCKWYSDESLDNQYVIGNSNPLTLTVAEAQELHYVWFKVTASGYEDVSMKIIAHSASNPNREITVRLIASD